MRIPDWTQRAWTDELGSATLEPASDVVAGSFTTWTITYRVGCLGIDEHGTVKLAFRQACNFSFPQFEDPAGEGYTTVRLRSRSGARLRSWFDPKGHIRHWRQAITVEVLDDPLWEGDTITIVLGETGGGCPGLRVQTFNQESSELKVFVDTFGTGAYQPMPDSPRVRIAGGPAARLAALLPSEAAVGEKTWLLVKAEDRHGNPAEGYAGTVRLTLEGGEGNIPEEVLFDGRGIAVRRIEDALFESEGVFRLRAQDEEGRQALSNPLVVRRETAGPRLRWGDLHGGQTEGTVGVGTFEEFYRFARDTAALEFTTHQGNDFEVTTEEFERLREVTRKFHEPGRFVPFLGYEWSGTTPMGGDHAVFFFDDDASLHRCSHWLQTDLSDAETDLDHITKLHEHFRGRRMMTYPHIGGRPANLEFHDPEFSPVIEIHSTHGTFEWFLEEAIERGLKVGFVGGSDDHYGHPGAFYPGTFVGRFPARNGLMALYAEELSRESIWRAIKARRCYGTTGERIILRFSVNGRPMGEEVEAVVPPRIELEAIGTGPIDRVEVFRGLERIRREEVTPRDARHRLRILFAGARVRGRGRAVVWNGGLEVRGNRIRGVEPVALVEGRDGADLRDGGHLDWKILTAGEARGFVLDLGGGGGELEIRTEPARFTCAIPEALQSGKTEEAGGVARRVEIERAPEAEGPWEARLSFTDEEAPPGLNVYWMRLTQVNQEKAWSSPVWVTLR